MPRATVTTDTVRKDLQSAPPDGFVVLRPMPYGAKLNRSQEAMKMTMRTETGNGRRGQKASSETEMVLLQKAATMLDFRICIVQHNLTKVGPDGTSDVPMNLGDPADFDQLDPRIGEEISTLIDELNNFEAPTAENPAGEEGNSETR